ncbi:MAG: nickel pincer cofactor biosynthesis protein LarC [Planctomycetes bacterium]|nr:nickel pincer cofactor biosynthesis protein LarC [Planctomycetota bacterium]
MRVAVLDAWSGVAGDMWVGAMLDAGLPLAPLVAAVDSLRLPGVRLQAAKVLRGGLAGTHFTVAVDRAGAPGVFTEVTAPRLAVRLGVVGDGDAAHVHRGLREIEAIVGRGDLPAPVRDRCLAVYRAIGAVEAAAHGCAIDDVHFHEVGAEDTIVDVVCVCLGMHLFGVEAAWCNGLEVGSGTVRAAHGELPVPAPATAALLRGIPHRSGGLTGERTTPTGAALLRTLVQQFDRPLTWTTDAIGYGAGTRDFADTPNLLRLALGHTVAPTSPVDLVELACQVDTATGEQIGWLLDELARRGAVDAFATPVQMKKGRPGWLLTVLADAAHAAALSDLLLAESSSLGVRSHRVQRSVLERWQETRDTAFGPVVWKCARLPNGQVVARPEDDELRRLCAAHGLGRAELLQRLTPGP